MLCENCGTFSRVCMVCYHQHRQLPTFRSFYNDKTTNRRCMGIIFKRASQLVNAIFYLLVSAGCIWEHNKKCYAYKFSECFLYLISHHNSLNHSRFQYIVSTLPLVMSNNVLQSYHEHQVLFFLKKTAQKLGARESHTFTI